MKKSRKHYTPEEKVAILRHHLLEKESISKLCDELGLQPTVFYRRISGMTHVRNSPFYPQSTGRSSVGTNRSKGNAFGQERRCRSMMLGVW